MTARLLAQQEVERARRNDANLMRWHVKAFGPVIGKLLATDRDGYMAAMTELAAFGSCTFMVPSDGSTPYHVDIREVRLP